MFPGVCPALSSAVAGGRLRGRWSEIETTHLNDLFQGALPSSLSGMAADENLERAMFDHFARTMPDLSLQFVGRFPEGKGPDFKAETNGRIVGIELTEPDGGLFKEIAHQYNVREKTERILRSEGYPPGLYNVLFQNHCWRGAINHEKLARELANAIKLRLTPGYDEDLDDLSPQWISRISIMAYPPPESSVHVGLSMNGFYIPLPKSLVQQTLEKKESKVRQYRSAVPEVWLLIACRFDRCGWFELPKDVAEATYTSGFDRVFFMEAGSRRSHEFKLAPAST
jgi:hypothetical protein